MNPYVYLAAFLFLIVAIKLSAVPFKFMIRGLKGITYLIILTSLINIFLTRGEPVFTVWKLTGTREGIRLAIYMVFRFCFLICGSSLLTFTTQPVRLTDGLEKIFAFLRIFKVPVHDMAMMMSIALRFIPILIEETNIIMNAQLSRGADFENGNLIKRTKSLLPVLIPLFMGAFKRATDLAMAMDARCYRGGKGRTRLHPLKYTKDDLAAYLVTIVYLMLIIMLGKYGYLLPFGNDILK